MLLAGLELAAKQSARGGLDGTDKEQAAQSFQLQVLDKNLRLAVCQATERLEGGVLGPNHSLMHKDGEESGGGT